MGTSLLEEDIEVSEAVAELKKLGGNSLFYANIALVIIQNAIKNFDDSAHARAFSLASQLHNTKLCTGEDLFLTCVCKLFDPNVIAKLEAENGESKAIIAEGTLAMDKELKLVTSKADGGELLGGDIGDEIRALLEADRVQREKAEKEAATRVRVAEIVKTIISSGMF